MKKNYLNYLRDGKALSFHQQILLTLQLSFPAILAQLTSVVMQYIDASMVGHLGANASAGDPATLTFKVGSVSTDNNSAVYTLEIDSATGLGPQNYRFIQDETAVKAGIAVHPYGAFIMPEDASAYTAKLACGSSTYTAGTALTPGTTEAGATIVFTKD